MSNPFKLTVYPWDAYEEDAPLTHAADINGLVFFWWADGSCTVETEQELRRQELASWPEIAENLFW